jgi:hypothetical protein
MVHGYGAPPLKATFVLGDAYATALFDHRRAAMTSWPAARATTSYEAMVRSTTQRRVAPTGS